MFDKTHTIQEVTYKHHINYFTLRWYYLKHNENLEVDLTPRCNFHTVFSKKTRTELSEYLIMCSKKF